MATFVMIHGAWHGGWCFEPLRSLVEARGHQLIAPDLPGIGGSDETVAAITLEGWTAFVADLIATLPERVILCGHSRGGIVISQVADRVPARLIALVYITAFLLPSGSSLNDALAEVPRIPAFEAGVTPSNDGYALAVASNAALAAFYNRSPPALRDEACRKLVPEPLRPLATPLHLESGFYEVPRYYIECADDRAIPLEQQRMMQIAMPCVQAVTLDSDHSPFFTCPIELVDALVGIASTAGA